MSVRLEGFALLEVKPLSTPVLPFVQSASICFGVRVFFAMVSLMLKLHPRGSGYSVEGLSIRLFDSALLAFRHRSEPGCGPCQSLPALDRSRQGSRERCAAAQAPS